MKQEIWTQEECDLMVELCRYHAQTLLALRNGIDTEGLLPKIELPEDGVVPAGTILLDGAISAYECAAGALLKCNFAVIPEKPYNACQLIVASDQFKITTDIEIPLCKHSALGYSFAAMFRVYEQSEQLGHPSTMKRVFDCCMAAGLIEERYGYNEWSEKALDLAYPRRRSGNPRLQFLESEFLWVTDTLDWFLEEAKLQWT